MEDAVTSNPGTITDALLLVDWRFLIIPVDWIFLVAPPHVIDLPDDDDEVLLRARRKRRAPAGKTPTNYSGA